MDMPEIATPTTFHIRKGDMNPVVALRNFRKFLVDLVKNDHVKGWEMSKPLWKDDEMRQVEVIFSDKTTAFFAKNRW